MSFLPFWVSEFLGLSRMIQYLSCEYFPMLNHFIKRLIPLRTMSTYPKATEERSKELVENVDHILNRVNSIKSPNGRPVNLVCVSKLKPSSDIMALYDAGFRHFGENYVQELVSKAQELPKDIKWHFIGGLQTNKCKDLATRIDNLYAVETIDSIKKANKLNSSRDESKPKINVFIQVNTSGEEQKSGISSYEDLLSLAKVIKNDCPNLILKGLMTIGSIKQSTAAGERNEDFDQLSSYNEKLESDLGTTLELSMGMSSDFEQAIKQGSTSVRVGSNIFGARPPRNGH
ncbi:BA75_02678T0 [Komagataella pastoris]|uniref:Pyridoxal phosphate homeostasis protein n=1 Tax=Komagataella pastoris TaxID=4922 RepID=A0A1B2JBD0_PICPA|nr:BA75_02678T0 [Komagataella pastoris]